jgi:hypothetical protein
MPSTTWIWMKKSFHLLDLAIQNRYINFSSLGIRKFRIANFETPHWEIYWHRLGRNGLCKGQFEDHLLQRLKSLGLKTVAVNSALIRLPREDVCAGRGVTRNVSVICERCDVAMLIEAALTFKGPMSDICVGTPTLLTAE